MDSASIAEMSYEDARDELILVVNKLEQGGITLEDSLKLWERGEALATRCEDWLLGARKRLEAARTVPVEKHADTQSNSQKSDSQSETK